MADPDVRARAASWSRGFSKVLDGTMMLTENTGMHGPTAVHTLLLGDESTQLGALRNGLPAGWAVELRSEPGMAWVAFVYQPDAPRGRPMFSVCRWDDGVGLFAQWMDGSACSAMAFTELWPILELILDGIFVLTQAHLATVPTKGWACTQH